MIRDLIADILIWALKLPAVKSAVVKIIVDDYSMDGRIGAIITRGA